MKTQGGVICLSEIGKAINIQGDFAYYMDTEHTKIQIPLSVIVRLYELAKFEAERQGKNWESEANILAKT
jgi:hypothetical protein